MGQLTEDELAEVEAAEAKAQALKSPREYPMEENIDPYVSPECSSAYLTVLLSPITLNGALNKAPKIHPKDSSHHHVTSSRIHTSTSPRHDLPIG